MSDLSLPVRITAARRLLSEGMEEYHDLPPQCQAHLQEAIEFLTQVESRLEANGSDLGGNGAGLGGNGAGPEANGERDGSGPEGDGGKK